MGEPQLDDIIPETKAMLEGVISKPKATPKLLSRPPMRYLRDVILNVIDATGCFDGLYTEDEIANTSPSKAEKIAFLQKVINCTGLALGQAIDVRAQKIVAGLEPVNTNLLLQAFVRAATSGVDSAEAVRRTLAGEEPGDAPAPDAKASRSEAKSSKAAAEPDEPKARPREDEPARVSESKRARSPEPEAPPAKGDSPEPVMAKGGDAGASGGGGGGWQMDGESIDLTKELLEAVISRPRMSSKNLGRPPFRFVLDIVKNITQATGFAADLFDDDAYAEAPSSRDTKVAFLEKIIAVTSIAADIHIPAKASKIVAGAEADKTNIWLQVLAQVCQANDGANAVRAVQGGATGLAPGEGSGGAAQAAPAPARAAKVVQPEPVPAPVAAQAKGQTEDDAAPSKGSSSKGADREEPKRAVTPDATDAAGAAAGGGGGGDDEAKPATRARPTTARRAPPKLRDNVQEAAPDVKHGTVAAGIMLDGAGDDDDDDSDEEPAEAMAKAGAIGDDGQHSKMVQDILDKERADEEAKRAAAAKEEEEKKKQEGGGIRMGRLKKASAKGAKESSAASAKGISDAELYELRRNIQLLCRSTNPLGKCMEFVHDDMEMMRKELDEWKAEYRRKTEQLEEESRETDESLQALQLQLMEADEQVKEQIQKINSVKASISKNDRRINQLLRAVVSV